MAPKRSAPPPPPPVESSAETDSGSGSYESEEESPQSPPTAGPRIMAPPPQVQQPEASDEEEEEEDEEEEEEEEDEDEVNHMAPPSATQNPTPPQNLEWSESDEEGDEETDDEAPQRESAPKHEANGKGGNPAPSSEDKKPVVPFQRAWSKDDEVRILEALAAHRREHGSLPQPEDIEATLAGNLDNSDYGRKELAGKLRSLKAQYTKTVRRGDPPSNDTDRRILDLSKEVWGGGGRAANGTAPSDFGEVCEMYPYLAEEMKVLERTEKGLFKREFSLMDNDKARTLDQKIKKQRMLQMKLELRHHDMIKEVTKTLMDLME